ncbi:E3 ubiquitin-protein ligase [Plasmodium brasilianum]|uniref:E3 ubiquitin-protein ligase, putative n=3 Tax=Plasmodium (Plasmodium) TaxID=418103 RepID=A0A1D3PAN1_PLAMA|nr:E3 ubiquitin-protein ligase, putative [Plasmodium malariae]KAI4838922.1 E3 ubiquitin-protein ligase [Plasmodium brasilianum]SCN12267.1 E3 ubiquitin-protein ligase, putative [Plasmodium malariae]
MNIIDEYDLDMYKNIVMSNNCKDEDLLCIFNTSSFLNTLCFFIFFIMFLWALAIISRYYTSYSIIKYLKNRKAIYMKNMSRHINEIKMLCRSHVNDIIRIKKKITPKNVKKINLNISINNNIQLFKNYLSSSCNDLNSIYKYSITFTFSSKNSLYIRLFWGVLLNEVNEMIQEKTESYRNSTNGQNTVICIDNFRNFFKEGFSKSIPSKRTSDATTFLLDKQKSDYYSSSEEDSLIDFSSCFYKTSNSFYTSGNNITYTMPYDEGFCVTEILSRIEREKRNNNNSSGSGAGNNYGSSYSSGYNCGYYNEYRNNYNNDNNSNSNSNVAETNDRQRVSHVDSIESKIMNSNAIDELVRIPLIIVLNDICPNEEYYLNKSSSSCSSSSSSSRNNRNMKGKNNHSNALIVLVDFKKMKDKYKPYIIKDICILNENISSSSMQKSKKKKDLYQFVDILDIYGHEEHDKECLICMTSYKDTLLMPCRHSSFCYDCMKSLRQEKCPICRCLFTSFIKFPLKNLDKGDVN